MNVVPLFKQYVQLSGQLDEFKKSDDTGLPSLTAVLALEMTHEKETKSNIGQN